MKEKKGGERELKTGEKWKFVMTRGQERSKPTSLLNQVKSQK